MIPVSFEPYILFLFDRNTDCNSPERDLNKTARLTSWISFAYTEKTGVYLSVYYHSSEEYPWLKLEENN